jgi:hypothetical protein
MWAACRGFTAARDRSGLASLRANSAVVRQRQHAQVADPPPPPPTPHGRLSHSVCDDTHSRLLCRRFFDCSKAGNKHPYQGIQDTHNVLSATFHPSGDFVFAGTEHNMVCEAPINRF